MNEMDVGLSGETDAKSRHCFDRVFLFSLLFAFPSIISPNNEIILFNKKYYYL